MKIYYGIVDALGLESFIRYNNEPKLEAEQRLSQLKLRAQFNPQRNAVAYKIKLSEETIEIIKDLMTAEHFIKAGKIITTFLDKINGTKLTETNKHLQKIQELRGYL